MNLMKLCSVLTALVLLSLAGGWAAAATTPGPTEIEWLKATAIPLASCEAGRGFEDLKPLTPVIGDARIVSLGEFTHGTREVFQMKHRLVEFLASQQGFTIFSIEANMPEAYRLNDYVLEGKADPARLIAGMYFWTWNTEEVLAMVKWMREFNLSGKGRLEFTGFDMQTPDVAMENVVTFVRSNEPTRLKWVQEAYQKITKGRSQAPKGGAGGFAVATGTFPVQAARGKKIRYSGWIKTEGITRGFAGLWWRADGEAGVLAFNNMQDRGIKGDSDWTEYALELDIPEQAVNINFGAILPGDGKAWFDDLKVEIGGKEYDPGDRFDFGFEGEAPKGFFTAGAGYVVKVDDQVAHRGKKSLRMEYVGANDSSQKEPFDAANSARECSEILAQLEAGRERYAKTVSPRAADWAIQNARVVEQCLKMEAQELSRDECMARNVKWILDHAPKNTRLVLWAHNGHVARQRYFGGKAMGAYLDDWYHKEQLVLGFAGGTGRYTAILQGKGLRSDNDLQAPIEGSYEEVFHASGLPQFVLDLRRAQKEDPALGWLTRSRSFRSIGALAMDQQFAPANLKDLFDAVIYLDQTTASRPLTK
jgi:erythromycin esterase-like protein